MDNWTEEQFIAAMKFLNENPYLPLDRIEEILCYPSPFAELLRQ